MIQYKQILNNHPNGDQCPVVYKCIYELHICTHSAKGRGPVEGRNYVKFQLKTFQL